MRTLARGGVSFIHGRQNHDAPDGPNGRGWERPTGYATADHPAPYSRSG